MLAVGSIVWIVVSIELADDTRWRQNHEDGISRDAIEAESDTLRNRIVYLSVVPIVPKTWGHDPSLWT